MSFSCLDSKKNVIQKKKKEKLPVDIISPSEHIADKAEQLVALDIPHTKCAEPEARALPPPEALSSTRGSCMLAEKGCELNVKPVT